MQDKICWFTTLEFICSILAVLLTVTQPHAGNAVATWTGKVSLFALLPVGNWEKQQSRVGSLRIITN